MLKIKNRHIFTLATGLLFFCGCGMEPEAPPTPAKEKPVRVEPIEPPPKSEWETTASAIQEELYAAKCACDGKRDTRWSSPSGDPQWLRIDMGSPAIICGLTILWETAFSSEYHIETSVDDRNWKTVYSNKHGDGHTDEIYFAPIQARFVKIVGTKRGTGWGHSIWEIDLKGPAEKVQVTASAQEGFGGLFMFDGNLNTSWKSSDSKPGEIEIDLGKNTALGGIRIDWGDNHATALNMFVAGPNRVWKLVTQHREGTGKFDVLMHSRQEARYIRLAILDAAMDDKPLEIKEITLRGPDEELTPLALYELAAEKAEPGRYPDHLRKRQVYWTLIGLPADSEESLLDEYGNLEVKSGRGSLMPFISVNGHLFSAFDAEEVTQALENRHLPIPSVTWSLADLDIRIQGITRGGLDASATYVCYSLTNTSPKPREGRLYLAIRPVQINPKWQHGGLSPIRSMAYVDIAEGPAVSVNGKIEYVCLSEPTAFGSCGFDRGDIVKDLARGRLPEAQKLEKAGDYISGALAYDFKLAPGETKSLVVAAPLHNSMVDIRSFNSTDEGEMLSPTEAFDYHLTRLKKDWSKKLDKVRIEIPQQEVIDTMKAQIGYILINQDGMSIQPGSRNYNRAWIRDGSLTSAALLRMGMVDEVRDYLNWYSRQVQPNGWVPPILEPNGEINKGFGWDNEYDSQGQYIYAIMEYYRFTRDRQFLEQHFDKIVGAMKYLVELRDKTLQPGYMSDQPAPERFVGILPKSISHEGYSPPMHSYWDDFFALKGWKDGRDAAKILGREDIAEWAEEQYRIFRDSMRKSIKETAAFKKIDYVPGCAEKGDADATSTAIAFFPCQEGDLPPHDLMQNIFDLYYEDLSGRLDPGWTGGFTPYEIRSILAFVKLGQKARANVLLDYMLTCRRPAGWKHLAEVVYSDPRLGSYIGDMPHTWVGSGYVNSVRGMLVYEEDGVLVLLAGVPEKWVRGKGLLVERLPTHFGLLDMIAKAEDRTLTLTLGGHTESPQGIAFHWPLEGKPARVTVDGETWTDYDETLCRLPNGTTSVVAEW